MRQRTQEGKTMIENTYTVNITDVRQNDRIVQGLKHKGRVKGASYARTNVHVMLLVEGEEEARKVVVARDTKVEVVRLEFTEEERVAGLRIALARNITSTLEGWVSPRKALQDAMKGNWDGGLLTWSNTETILKQQAKFRVRERVEALQQEFVTKGVDSDTAWLGAWKMAAERGTDEVRYADPLSRSTSVLSNVLDDLDRWAMVQLIDMLRWYGGADTQALLVDALETVKAARFAYSEAQKQTEEM